MPEDRADHLPGVPPPQMVAAPRPAGPAAVRPEHLYKGAGLLFLLLVAYHYLEPLVQILLVVFAAAIVAVGLNAVVGLFPRQRRWVAAGVGLLIFAGLGAGVWFGVSNLVGQVRGLAQQWPAFEAQVRTWEEWLRQSTGLNIQLLSPQATSVLRRTFLGQDGQEVIGRARGLVEILAFPLIVIFGGLFAVGKPNERLLTPLLRAVPADRRPAFHRLFALLGVRLLGWIKGTLIAMVLVGLLSGTAFWLLGLEYALILGIWAGLTEFIPILGPWIGGLVAVLVAFLQDPQLALWTALVVLAVQQVEANLITPLVMSRTAEIHPFVTLFALLLFGSLFGFLGILLALPLVLLVWTVVQVLWVERAIDTDEDRIPQVVKE